MIGTMLNIVTVLVGGITGLIFGQKIPNRVRHTIIHGIGLFTLALGVSMFLESGNPLIVLIALLLGGLLGEWIDIEKGLESFGSLLQRKYQGDNDEQEGQARFMRGFLTASLLFEVGPLTILGSIQDGLTGDFRLLATKSVLDGFAAVALASSMGIGVLFSIVVVFIYQGGISLLASRVQSVMSETMIAEMTAVGGVLLLGLSVSSLLEIKKIRTGNLLPALAVAPLISWLIGRFQ
jgi:hypothetical protein